MEKDQKEKGSNKPFILIGLVIVTIVFILIFNSYPSNENNFNMVSVEDDLKKSSIEKSENIETSCTRLEYTRWSSCSEDGNKTRVVNTAYPQGCYLGKDVVQQQSCEYVPLKLEAINLFKKTAQQITMSSGRSVVSSYVSGQDGDSISTVRWTMSDDDNLLIWHIAKDRQTENITDSIFLRDSNQDFRPDIFSLNGTEWDNIASQSQEIQRQLLSLWALDMTYFGLYLLN